MAAKISTFSFTKRLFEPIVWQPGISLVQAVLPDTLQSRLVGTFPEKVNSNRKQKTKESTMVARTQTATEADAAEGNAGATVSGRVEAGAGPEADRCVLDTAFGRAKYYISVIAAMATGMGAASQASGINWRSGSQGLELILNSGREQVHCQYANHDPGFERWTYINGVQHLLRGLPADLDPIEAAILHHAMPPALAEISAKPLAGNQQQDASCGIVRFSNNRNMVQAVIVFIIGLLHSVAISIIPKIAGLTAKAYELEQERRYVPRLTLAASRLLRILKGVFRRFASTAFGEALYTICVYAAEGVTGAATEFAQDMVAEMEMSGG
ncbi:hypothetical protein C8A03DRAFT_34744 [Achaetomium macrosporum]|uniref:Uncharacterized protein n=1 Tax=Achaetomium macrosporum TaxID=79813 RepID=A0AAN7C9J7_9PEZI|nr:hypothetical protein C8A03DRAFT_34744 [Achaetomium macrosporum]